MKTENLFRAEWAKFDSHELRLALAEFFGSPGQYDDALEEKLYLPLAGQASKISIQFKEKKIFCIELGQFLDRQEWQKIATRIESALSGSHQVIGKGICFSYHQTNGWWRGERSHIQILPAPQTTLPQNFGMAQHPFVVEFPIIQSEVEKVTLHRRWKTLEEIALLFNLLLAGRTSLVFGNGDQSGYVNFGDLVVEKFCSPSIQKIEEIPREKYEKIGNDGLGLRVPANLDDLIMQFGNLECDLRKKFKLALYWWDMASRCWNISAHSLSFAALVSSVEALTVRGAVHNFECPVCGGDCQHEVPGATERFRKFLEKFASGEQNKTRRSKMYALRSQILHGSDLMMLDRGTAFGWDPPSDNEFNLHRELSALVRSALRNWLENASVAQGDNLSA